MCIYKIYIYIQRGRSVIQSVNSEINIRSDLPPRCRRSSRPIVLSFASLNATRGDVQIRVRGKDILCTHTYTHTTGFPSGVGWLAGRTYIHTYIWNLSFLGSRQGKGGQDYGITMMHGKSSSFIFYFTTVTIKKYCPPPPTSMHLHQPSHLLLVFVLTLCNSPNFQPKWEFTVTFWSEIQGL